MLFPMRTRLLPVLAVLSASAALLAGQQPPTQTPPPASPQQTPVPPPFRSKVEMVRLDVSVLDNTRLPVPGLKMGDFTVLENGKPQKLAAFTEVEVPEPIVPTTAWMKEVEPDIRRNDDLNDRRLILIVLDDAMISSMSVRSTNNVKTAARTIIDQLGAADLAAVIYTLDSRNVQEFTSDRSKLLAAIDRFSPGFGGDQELFERYSVGTLLRASEYMAEIPQRRKAMFYISTGVAMNLDAIARPTYAGREGTGGDPTGRAAWILEQMQDVFRQAQLANVNIHAIDPSALDGLAGARVFDPHKDFLFTVSENTGGFPIVNRDDYAVAIAQVFLENSSYYLLGYEPVIPDDGRYRRIEVKVNRPGLIVRARSGYYAPDAVKPVKSSAGAKAGPSPLWKAISGLLPVGDLPLQVTAAPFAAPGEERHRRHRARDRQESTPAPSARSANRLSDWRLRPGRVIEIGAASANVTLKPGVKARSATRCSRASI
jgi:VWFA-related protein